jgi:hypothetical protein
MKFEGGKNAWTEGGRRGGGRNEPVATAEGSAMENAAVRRPCVRAIEGETTDETRDALSSRGLVRCRLDCMDWTH